MANARKILENIIAIHPGNIFLEYIVDRIQDDDYRGVHISQHNRYDLDRLTKILNGIYEIVGDDYFRVPLGDDIDGYRYTDCKEYYKIVDNVSAKIGMGTINSLKKNFFVDFQRLGFLDRFDKELKVIPNDKRAHIYWARLTTIAIKFIKSGSLTEKYRVFTDAIDNLFADEITNIADTLYYSNYKNDRIGIDEFMFILSDDRPNAKDKKIDLIDSYRSLERWQKDKAIDLIKKYCEPDNFKGNKTQKRDFGNWKNESQQIFTLLKNTVYFDITQNSLRLNTGRYGIFEESKINQRGLGAKQEYFKRHKLNKMENFELHHVIELSLARNKEEFKLIDSWKNLIYLGKNKHAEITRNGNRNKILTATEKEIFFDDYNKNRIIAQNRSSALYDGGRAKDMQNCNREILKEMFGYVAKESNF